MEGKFVFPKRISDKDIDDAVDALNKLIEGCVLSWDGSYQLRRHDIVNGEVRSGYWARASFNTRRELYAYLAGRLGW